MHFIHRRIKEVGKYMRICMHNLIRVIQVVNDSNQLIDGKVALEDHERRWKFTPAEAWRRGPHALQVQTTIEDLAGNNIGKAFEVDLFENVQRRFTNSTIRLPFAVR